MRVLLTGGTGQIGKAAVERLLEHGWDVRVLDIGPDVQIDGAEYVQCNVLDYDAVLRHLRGCDEVVHLAALRGPSLGTGHDVFESNVMGTFNVFEAAATVGLKRVVHASSINALGATYSLGDMKIDYFPVDEAHPNYTTDPYSFSKQTVEAIGEYYWRRERISSIAFRYPGVYNRGQATDESFLRRQAASRQVIDELASLPESERRAQIEDTHRRVMAYRATRAMEYHPGQPRTWPNYEDDPLFSIYAFERFNFWANLDERDAAQALEKALTADYEGPHVLFANDRTNWLNYDSRTLVRLFFPDVTDIRPELTGASPLVSIDNARRLIGFEPEFSLQPA